MDDRQLRQIVRRLERPDIVSMTLAEVMVALVFLVFIIGAATGAFATSGPSREDLEADNRRLKPLQEALRQGLGKADVVPADVNALFSRLVDLSSIEQEVIHLRQDLAREKAARAELATQLSADSRKWYDSYHEAAEHLRQATAAREAAEAKARAAEERAAQADALRRELAGVRQERQILLSRVDKLEEAVDGRGVEAPACWRQDDEPQGRLQYVLRIRLFDDGLYMEPAWPAEREEQAQGLGLRRFPGTEVSPATFESVAGPIYRAGVRQGCRYFVETDDSAVTQADALRRQRALVERFFYVKWGAL